MASTSASNSLVTAGRPGRPARGAIVAACIVLAAHLTPAMAQVASPHAIDHPAWFVETFLDVRDDIAEARKSGKRLMLYFGQDGCPYCRELLQNNFSQKAIADKARKHLLPIGLNIWGDRPVTWIDGRQMPEKDLARLLKVQFTPTLLFFDEKGEVIVRLNGYLPPNRLEPAIDYVAGRMESKVRFAEYAKTAVVESAGDRLNEQPFFLPSPSDLRRKPGGKPLAVVFETRHCKACDEMHREGFVRPDVRELVARFDVVRFSLADRSAIVTPDNMRTTADAWAKSLGIAYTPSIVFFEPAGGREVFRIEAYLRPFHLASSFEYVATGAWKEQPSFQRFLQARAERIRARTGQVDLWK